MTLSYRELNDNSEEVPGNVLALMLSMRHSCNPDFESQYEHVVKWYAEIDTTMARVLREIGLDHSGNPIVLGPFGRNDGLWTGVSASVGVDIHHTPTISKDLFDSTWNKLEDVYRNTIPPKKIEPRIPVEHIEQITDKWSGSALGRTGKHERSDHFILTRWNRFFRRPELRPHVLPRISMEHHQTRVDQDPMQSMLRTKREERDRRIEKRFQLRKHLRRMPGPSFGKWQIHQRAFSAIEK